jgi:hypothetical protein
MNESTRIRGLWTLAGAALLAGIGMTVLTVRDLRSARDQMERTAGTIEKLQAQEKDLSRRLEAREMFEQLARKRPVALSDLLQKMLPGSRADESKEVRQELPAGWTLRRKEIGLADVSFAKMMEFAQAAEAQRPPWRLVKCTLRASSREDGVGQAALLFDALEKRE